MKPLCIDLFCGRFGWSKGFIAEGFRAVGFDLAPPIGDKVPKGAELVIQDVLTLHGSQFKDAAVIVGSSPCQEFSYRAMPFKRCKALPPPVKGIELFNAQFRIQREACEATARDCPSCGGKGFAVWYVNDVRPCERCAGTGIVRRHTCGGIWVRLAGALW